MRLNNKSYNCVTISVTFYVLKTSSYTIIKYHIDQPFCSEKDQYKLKDMYIAAYIEERLYQSTF